MRRKRYRITVAVVIGTVLLLFVSLYWWPAARTTRLTIPDEAGIGSQKELHELERETVSASISKAEPSDAVEESPGTNAGICVKISESDLPEYPPDITESDFAGAAEKLMDSPDPQHLVAAALLTFGEEKQSLRIARFDRALAANPADPVTLSLVFSECGREDRSDWCERHDIENRLIAADSSNSETWALIADRRLRFDDKDGGLEALERAAAAPVMNSYFVEKLDIVEHGLAATGTGTYGQRFIAAMGVAAAQIRPYGRISRHCGELSPLYERWRAACLANGKKMESQSRTTIGYLLGLGLQRAVYRAIGDERRLKAIGAIRRDFKKRIDEGIDADFEKHIYYDEAFVAEYSDYFKNKGELAAWDYRQERLEAWRAERCNTLKESASADPRR